MDSILLILKYIFQNKNRESNFDSIDSFFEDGVSFPTFITLIFDDDEIPNIIKTPSTEYDKKSNNDIAFRYVLKNNEDIAEDNPKFESSEDKNDLLEAILTKQCFTLDHDKILDICNSLVKPLDVTYDSEDDLLNLENLVTILHVLTNKKVKNITDDYDDIDEVLSKSFKKANIPLILNSDSFDDQNPFNFYIQIEIIFDHLLDKSKYEIGSKLQLSESSEKISLSEMPKSKKKSRFWDFLRKKEEDSDISSDTTEYYSDDEDEKDNEDMQNDALLKTLNAIGSKSGIIFNDFESAVKNDAIPKFVMNFFNCNSIKNVEIVESKEEEKKSRIISGRLTEQQIKNINAVIEFIKEKKEKFKILLFDFEDIKNIESSTISFYTNFLNCFFIKKLKQEMYQRTVRLVCSHTSKFDEKYNDLLFTKYKIYPCLLHFIKNGNLHFDFNYHKEKFDDKKVQPYFKNADVPMIINKELLLYAKKYVSFPIFYQLQFIFDALDNNSHSSCFIVEVMMNALFSIKTIKVPKFSELATSIKAKQNSLKYQSEMTNKYRGKNELKKEKNYTKKEKKEIVKPKTFNDIAKDESSLEEMKNLIQSKIDDTSDEKIELKSFDEFWNNPDPDYLNDKGIIYNNKVHKKNKKKANTDWINEIANIQKNIQLRKSQSTNTNKNDVNVRQSLMFSRKKSGYEPKLNKLFTYNENKKRWELILDNFESFTSEKQINIKDSKTPLILFFNSYFDDLTLICSNLINTIYPNLEKDNPDEIFVYALCDRSLTMLNFVVDFNNAEKASIKPIFLLLHVPKSKENHPHIRLIITQIYSFLSNVCDFDVTVLNSNHYLDQIEFIKDVLKISNNSGLINKDHHKNGGEEKSPFSFIYQPPSSSDLISNENNDSDENKDNQQNFVYKEPKFVFLVNDPAVQFTNEIDKKINQNEFFLNLVSQFGTKEIHLHYINVNEPETYEAFLNCMNDIIMKKCCLFWEMSANLNCIKHWTFCESFLHMIIKDDYLEDLENLINQRLLMLKQAPPENIEIETKNDNDDDDIIDEKEKETKEDKKSSKDKKSKDKKSSKDKKEANKETIKNTTSDSTDSLLYKKLFNEEISKVIPPKNTEFLHNCMYIKKMFDHKDCCNETVRKLLKENLQICADSHLNFIDQSISQKYFWNYQQMADIVNSHKKFLKNEFLCMIQKLIPDKLLEDSFEFNFDIVENQLKKDKKQIMKIMQPFIDKINIKNCTKVHDLRNTMKEGTNYAMKETENLREVKVTVQINKDLKSEIPQDF